jgi:hypothetical protein
MKKILLITALFVGGTAFSQASFGLKGGLNYGATGDYETISDGVEDAMTIEGKNKSGYHFGVFSKLEFLGIFLQPEVLYTSLNTDYEIFDYKLTKIDAPLLVGINVLGPLNVKVGPSFQYILKNEVENTEFRIREVDNQITVGYQLGAGIELGNLAFDARYEGAFTENTAFSDTASKEFSIDSRPSQWIFSVAYSFN